MEILWKWPRCGLLGLRQIMSGGWLSELPNLNQNNHTINPVRARIDIIVLIGQQMTILDGSGHNTKDIGAEGVSKRDETLDVFEDAAGLCYRKPVKFMRRYMSHGFGSDNIDDP